VNLAEIVLACLCLVAIVLVVWGTIERNRWGLRFGRVACPRCLRTIPCPGGLHGLRQTLFGGGTCAVCKTLVDKWGREIMPRHRDRVKAQKASQQ
jgi:hypothetical protein